MAVPIMRRGMLLIVSGPSGAGKGTLIEKLMDSDPSIRFSCSVTTRAPREGEIDGVHYHFISEAEYGKLLREDAFLEYATVHGHHYGTLKLTKKEEEYLAKGQHVLLDIDPQGALTVMEKVEGYVSVFILPPSFNALRVRLHSRNTDDRAEIERRLNNARAEVKNVHRYQYAVINDDVELAFAQLQGIVNAEKQRTTRFIPNILDE